MSTATPERITTAEAVAAIQRNEQALVTALGFAREAYVELAAEYAQYREDHPPDGPTPPAERVLMECDFSGYEPGPFTEAMARDCFGWEDPPPDSWWVDRGVSIATSDGRSVLSVRLKAGEYGGDSGPVFFSPFDPVAELTYMAELQFAPGFDFDMGGKLPGIACTIDSTTPPTGGAEPTDGNSCRHMWRTGGEAGSRPAGSAAAYVYSPNEDEEWGSYEFLEDEWAVDAYKVLTTHVKANTPGQRNGLLQSKLGDGPWGLDRSDFLWVPSGADPDAWRFNRFAFAVFRGGSESSWAASSDGLVQFRRFKITTPA